MRKKILSLFIVMAICCHSIAYNVLADDNDEPDEKSQERDFDKER